MSSALLVRFRPAGPWRLGSDSGVRTHVGSVLHSDTLYSAITLAMRDCGWLDEWIAATAGSRAPAVRISSGYPFSGSTLLVQPPRTVWPPAQGGKLRWKTARFVPLTMVPKLLAGEVLLDDQWAVDPVSECLLPVFRNSIAAAPFRIVERVLAPVDRVTGATESVDRIACLQFAQGSGIWFMAAFADEGARSVWAGRMRSVARLLADTGIGGGRSRGWGRSREPQFGNVDLPEFLTGGATAGEGEAAWWLLSLYSPADEDKVDWDRGTYSVILRAGRTENGELKPASRMVAEGSVVLSGSPPAGTARNVAPAELSHPVYRSGIALAVPVPYFEKQRWELTEHAPATAAAPGGEVEGTSAPAVVDEIPVGVDTAGVIAPVAEEEFASAEVGTGVVPGEELDSAAFEPVEDTRGEIVPEPETSTGPEPDRPPAAPPEAPVTPRPETPAMPERETPTGPEPDRPPAAPPEAPVTPRPETPLSPRPDTPAMPAPETPAVLPEETPAAPAPETPATPVPDRPPTPPPDMPLAPEPETPITPTPETPATPEPETPAAPPPETPSMPEPETPMTPAPETPSAPPPEAQATPQEDETDEIAAELSHVPEFDTLPLLPPATETTEGATEAATEVIPEVETPEPQPEDAGDDDIAPELSHLPEFGMPEKPDDEEDRH